MNWWGAEARMPVSRHANLNDAIPRLSTNRLPSRDSLARMPECRLRFECHQPPEDESPSMLKVSNLELTYNTDQGGVRAVRGVSFTIERGKFFTLLGPSGCGKTS